MAFKFPVRRHFGFYDVQWMPNCFTQKMLCFLTTMATIAYKMAACGKFNSNNYFHFLLLLNAVSPLQGI